MLLLLALVFGGGVMMAVTGRSVPMPVWLVERIEARVNRALAGQGRVVIGAVDLLLEPDWSPRLRFRAVSVQGATGTGLAKLPDVRVTLSPQALLRGIVQPVQLRVIGAQLTARRDAGGAVSLDLAGVPDSIGATLSNADPAAIDSQGAPGSATEMMAAVDQAFALPILAGLQRFEAEGLVIVLQDARAGRTWRTEGGRLLLTQTPEAVTAAVALDWPNPASKPSRASVEVTLDKRSREVLLSVDMRDVPAADLASQAPALAWLGPLDAPISGDLQARVGANGLTGPMVGRLEIGTGWLRPAGVADPVDLKAGRVEFAYDPRRARVEFTTVELISQALRLTAAGHIDLAEMTAGLPESLIAQLSFSDVTVDPAGLFSEPVRFSEGAIDLRLRLDPFRMDIGQVVLVEDGGRIEGHGSIGAEATGWDVAFDLALDRISHDRLLVLWPNGLVPMTRNWLAANVQTSQLFDVKAALRLAPQTEPRLALGYEFTDTDVRFVKTLPPIRQATGYAEIAANSFVLVVDKGIVTPPLGGPIDMTGSVFRVPDIRVHDAPAVIDLQTDSTITAVLSLLNEPPFGFLTKAGQPVDAAQGRARLAGRITLPLGPKVLPEDVGFSVGGQLSAVASDQLVPGRQLASAALTLGASPDGMAISGEGTIDGVPFEGRWSQGFGPEAAGVSRVAGTVELSRLFLKAFKIGLPEGSVSGRGTGTFAIDLKRGGVADFTLASDLKGLALRIPQIGWSKGAGSGRLEMEGSLGAPPEIRKAVLEAPGLKASGAINLKADGTLAAARFSRVRIGDWLDGPVVLTGKGARRPVDVSMGGGRVDLRRANFGPGSAESGRLSVSLERLVISQGIALTGFRGDFSGRGGFNGRFGGLVNGQAPITGTVVPSNKRSAVRVQSADAGAVFRAAGVLDRAYGGTLDLTLLPTGVEGNYAGHLTVIDTKIRDAPALAGMLGAISVVGLLEQLNGDGIVFNDVQSDFLLTPRAIEVRQGSAIGASLGVTMAGLIDLGSGQMDFQGLISPIYLINGIGSLLTRKGEGLFGFDYRLRGTAEQPRVSVNPLSLLTPGMFRELFRRAPPSLQGAGN